MEKAFVKIYKSDYLYPETISSIFSHDHAFEICQRIREILSQDNKNKIEIQLEMMKTAQNFNLTSSNIFQIAKNIVKGQVTKLFISEKTNIFGKFDNRTGHIIIHPDDYKNIYLSPLLSPSA